MKLNLVRKLQYIEYSGIFRSYFKILKEVLNLGIGRNSQRDANIFIRIYLLPRMIFIKLALESQVSRRIEQ